LAGFDFAFQPSLDRNRILALAQREFTDRHEVVHFLGQPGCGNTATRIWRSRSALRPSRPGAAFTFAYADRSC
jgi:IstB-like ATP binding protein